jgi:hypothetical protein
MRSKTLQRLLFLVLMLFVMGGYAHADGPTPAMIIAQIKKGGSEKVVLELTHNDSRWDAVTENIQKGDKEWLEVARLLKPGSDAGSSEDLNFSVARALPRNPVDVLSLIDGAYFEIERVCTIPFIEAERDVEERYLKDVEGALLNMQGESDNHKVQTLRWRCLGIVQSLLKSLN